MVRTFLKVQSWASSGRCPSPAVCGFPAVWVVCEDVRCGVRLVAGGCLSLVRGGGVFRAVGGGLRLGFALVDVRLDVVPLPPRSSSPTVAGCRCITPHRHWRWGLCDSLCLVLLCGGRYGLGSVVLLFILGSSLGGVGPVRGLRGGGRGGWCEEWARSG
jgi:hypothetical protein